MSVLELFCDVDDFMLSFEPQLKASQLAEGKQHQRSGQLCPSKIMTILIHFHQSHYRNFKAYYTEYIQVYLAQEYQEDRRLGRERTRRQDVVSSQVQDVAVPNIDNREA